MMTTEQVTGVILAGGQGRRLGGQDKGLVVLNDRHVVEWIIEQFKPQTGALVINANRNIARYETFGLPVISDSLSDYQGPLAGFASAMAFINTPYLVTVPCDAPVLSDQYVDRLMEALEEQDADIAVAFDGERLQPVHCLLKTALLPSLQQFLEAGDRKIDLWFAKHKRVQVDFSDQREMFRNMNTPEQQHAIEAGIKDVFASR